MACFWILAFTLTAQPPSSATTEPVEPAESTDTTEPSDQAADAWAPPPIEPTPASSSESTVDFETSTVKKARYGLGISDVQVDRGPEKYRLHVRTWNEIVREDPDLRRYRGQGRMFGVGIAFTSIGGTWLAVSSALALDGHYAKSNVGALFQWFMPATITLTGAIMTIVAVRARSKLRAAHRRFYGAPYASAGQAGFTLGGRF